MTYFRCRRCGNCCRWSGAVRVSKEEIDRIAAYLNSSVEDFLEHRTVLLRDRSGLSLCEKADGSCEFLAVDENHLALCLIEKVKPEQCRKFPLQWNFPGWQDECKGFLEK